MIKNLIFHLFFISLAINAISQNTLETSDFKEALNHTEKADEKIDILLSLTDLYINNTPDTALVYALEAYNISIEKDLSQKQAGSMNRLARIYWLKNDLIKALDYSTDAHTIATDNNYSVELVEALINTGYIFLSLGDKNKSSEYFLSKCS